MIELAAHNRRLAKKRIQWLIEALCLVSSSVLAGSFVLRNPLLRQAPKRYKQGVDNQYNNKDIKKNRMYRIYKKQRIKEIPVEIDSIYNNIPNSSLLLLTKYSDFGESLFDKFGNELWKNVTSELFMTCIVNLLLTGKIKAVYYIDRKSIIFNLIKIDTEGFNIFSTENPTTNQHDDILANNILDALSKIRYHSPETYRLAINFVVNRYIGTGETSRPEKKFFHEYLKVYAKKNNWLKLIEDRKLLGFITDFNVILEKDKIIELQESQKKFHRVKFHLRKNNVLFRNFLVYTEKIVSDDFYARYPSD